MRASVAFIREQGLENECDLVETRAVDFFMNPESWKSASESLAAYAKAGGQVGEITAHDRDEAEQVCWPNPLLYVSLPINSPSSIDLRGSTGLSHIQLAAFGRTNS